MNNLRGWLLSAVTLVAAATLMVRAVGAAKELLVAHRYGTSVELDIFLVAYLLPAFVVNLIAGAMQSAIVPQYIHLRAQSPAEAQRYLGKTTTIFSLLLIGICFSLVPIALAVVPLLTLGWPADDVQRCFVVACLLAPLILLNGMTVFWSAMLNCQHRFLAPALVPMATPMLVCVLLLAFHYSAQPLTLVLGFVAGATVEMVTVGLLLRRSLGGSLFGRPSIDARHRHLLSQVLPVAGATLLMGVAHLFDNAIAGSLGVGNVSSLSYGNKIALLIAGVGAVAISTAALPYFSEMSGNSDWLGIRRRFVQLSLLILLSVVPITVVLMLTADDLIELVFNRGAFTDNDVYVVAQVHRAYVVQIPFYIWGMLSVRVLSSLSYNRAILLCAGINLVVDVTFNLLLSSYFGVVGVAITTTVVQVSASVILAILVIVRLESLVAMSGVQDASPGAATSRT